MKTKGYQKAGGFERCSEVILIVLTTGGFHEQYKILLTKKIPAGIYLLKVNNRSTRTRFIFTPSSTVSIVNFEHIITDWVESLGDAVTSLFNHTTLFMI